MVALVVNVDGMTGTKKANTITATMATLMATLLRLTLQNVT